MTVLDLIERLKELVPEDEADGVTVYLAQQPRWAFEYTIGDVDVTKGTDGDKAVYIGEGRQLGYLPEEAQDVLGWGRS